MRQTGYQVEAQVGKARAARGLHKFLCVRGGVQPAHGAQFLVLESLCPDAQTIDAHAQRARQELPIRQARSDLDREFDRAGHLKAPVESANDLLQFLRSQHGGGFRHQVDRIHGKRENPLAQT